MISVIIPCHNASSTLRMAVDSALAQSYPETEIIIIDDGSTDGSAQIIRSYGAAVIAKSQSNQGASAARNHGIQFARGDYIQYLDADDVLAPDTLAKRVAALEASGADVAYTDWQQFTISADGAVCKGQIIAIPFDRLVGDAEAACACSTFWAPPAAILYRRWVVDEIKEWSPRLPIIQDARFIFDAARLGARFTRVEGVGALYLVSANSLSRQSAKRFIRDCFVNAAEIEAMWCETGSLSATKRNALVQIWSYVAMAAFRANLPEFGEACRHLRMVSNRQHLDLRLRELLSEVVGQRAVWWVENKLRKVFHPLRQAARTLHVAADE
jgi:glycosyltransferase involved in cell wall biosynthesis